MYILSESLIFNGLNSLESVLFVCVCVCVCAFQVNIHHGCLSHLGNKWYNYGLYTFIVAMEAMMVVIVVAMAIVQDGNWLNRKLLAYIIHLSADQRDGCILLSSGIIIIIIVVIIITMIFRCTFPKSIRTGALWLLSAAFPPKHSTFTPYVHV